MKNILIAIICLIASNMKAQNIILIAQNSTPCDFWLQELDMEDIYGNQLGYVNGSNVIYIPNNSNQTILLNTFPTMPLHPPSSYVMSFVELTTTGTSTPDKVEIWDAGSSYAGYRTGIPAMAPLPYSSSLGISSISGYFTPLTGCPTNMITLDNSQNTSANITYLTIN